MVAALTLVTAGCIQRADDSRPVVQPASAQRDADPQPETTGSIDDGPPSWFFAQNAPQGEFSASASDGTGSLALDDPDVLTVAITERPARAVTHRPTADFAAGWDREFGDDPPNAVVAVLGADGRQYEAELELLRPTYTTSPARLTYPVRVLDGSLPEAFTDVSLMIDDAGLDVQLDIVNASDDPNDLTYVLYRMSQASQSGQAIVWRVIENLGDGDETPVEVGLQYTVSVTDSMGNTSPQLAAANGQQYAVSAGPTGDQLTASPSDRPNQIDVVNGLSQAAVTATLFDGGRPIAVVNDIAPGQTAVFQIEPTIWIAAMPTDQVQQGQLLDLSGLMGATKFSLDSVTSADIVITGDGTQFDLQNTVTD